MLPIIMAGAALLAAVGGLKASKNRRPTPGVGGLPMPQPVPGPPAAPLRQDMLVFNSDRTGNHEIFTMRADGTQQRQITNDPRVDSWWGRASPDRRRILFYRAPRGVHDTDYRQVELWMMNADGSYPRLLLARGAYGWALHGHAEWSPDGRQLVMFGGGLSPQIFITDTEGRSPRQITSRAGVNLDPSWSPDGRRIVFVSCPSAVCAERDYEIFTVPAAGGAVTRLTANELRDHDPYWSPDGRRIAWLAETGPGKWGPVGAWDVLIMNADGTSQFRLTSDGQINSKPHWSLDGQSLYFHRLVPGEGTPWTIWRMRADGTGRTALTTASQGNNEYPA